MVCHLQRTKIFDEKCLIFRAEVLRKSIMRQNAVPNSSWLVPKIKYLMNPKNIVGNFEWLVIVSVLISLLFSLVLLLFQFLLFLVQGSLVFLIIVFLFIVVNLFLMKTVISYTMKSRYKGFLVSLFLLFLYLVYYLLVMGIFRR
ncbi:MAG: hypothetical protein DRN71_05755 [Candidatus Nanohalarchaeota archaeon]|nr:MAG: hypothetical protein DRN71_05755 [Candidatus Nanohaloarchaeota archaeon]